MIYTQMNKMIRSSKIIALPKKSKGNPYLSPYQHQINF